MPDAADRPPVSAVLDQTVALRRRRIRHSVAPLGVAVELARLSLRHRQGRHRIGRAWARGRSGNHCHRRDQHPRPGAGDRPADRRGRRARAGRLRRRAVEPVPPRHGPRPPAARRGRSGRDRRLPRVGMSGHAAGDAGFAQGRARPWDFALRRRGRGAFRRRSARRRGRLPEADLQLPSTTCRTSTARPPPICRRRRSAGRSA